MLGVCNLELLPIALQPVAVLTPKALDSGAQGKSAVVLTQADATLGYGHHTRIYAEGVTQETASRSQWSLVNRYQCATRSQLSSTSIYHLSHVPEFMTGQAHGGLLFGEHSPQLEAPAQYNKS